MKVLIVYYSTYGHVHAMAEAIAQGVSQVDGAEGAGGVTAAHHGPGEELREVRGGGGRGAAG